MKSWAIYKTLTEILERSNAAKCSAGSQIGEVRGIADSFRGVHAGH
jgi:hypothetical protein